MSTKRIQIALDLRGGPGDGGQGAVEDGDKLRQGGVIPVVGGLHPHVVPDRFNGVELGAIGRQRAEMEAMSVVGEPLPHHRPPMIRGVVMDKEDLLPPIPLRHAAQEGCVTLSLKDLSMRKVKPGPVEIHRAEDLLGIALARRRNQWLVSATCPGLVETGVLPKTGFIPKEQRGLALSGFFLAWDRCIVAIDLAPPDRLWPTCGAASAPKSPRP